MRQQFVDLAVFLRRQASQHVLQIGIQIIPIELGTLNQTHHSGRTLARTQCSGLVGRCLSWDIRKYAIAMKWLAALKPRAAGLAC